MYYISPQSRLIICQRRVYSAVTDGQYNTYMAVAVLYLTYTTSDCFVLDIYTGCFICSPSQLWFRYK